VPVTVSESFQIIATLAAAQIVIAMVPGPNTILVAHAATRGRRYGWAAAAGVFPVGLAWATLGLTGLGATFEALPRLAVAMKLVCGLYLLWLGVKTVRLSFAAPEAVAAPVPAFTLLGAWRAGVLTNVTNPKTIAYYMSIFAATGAHRLGAGEQAIALVMMPAISCLWYGLVAATVASPPVARVLDRGRSWLDRLAGGIMLIFGLRLVLGRD